MWRHWQVTPIQDWSSYTRYYGNVTLTNEQNSTMPRLWSGLISALNRSLNALNVSQD